MESINDNPILVINDQRRIRFVLKQIRFVFIILAFVLLMAFGSVFYTMSVHNVVTDIGVVKELEAIKYNNQLYLNLVAHVDSVQDELLKIQQARMDTAALNRSEFVKRQRRADSIISHETGQRALTDKIQKLHIEELKKKGLWK